MNLIKACIKALAENKEDTTVSQVLAQGDSVEMAKLLKGDTDCSLDGRPAEKQSVGYNAIWLLCKVYSPKSLNEQVLVLNSFKF